MPFIPGMVGFQLLYKKLGIFIENLWFFILILEKFTIHKFDLKVVYFPSLKKKKTAFSVIQSSKMYP